MSVNAVFWPRLQHNFLEDNRVTDQTRQRQRGAIALAHEESPKDDLVEGSI